MKIQACLKNNHNDLYITYHCVELIKLYEEMYWVSNVSETEYNDQIFENPYGNIPVLQKIYKLSPKSWYLDKDFGHMVKYPQFQEYKYYFDFNEEDFKKSLGQNIS